MFWKTSRALDERTEFVQLDHARWKATYRGFVTVSAEGLGPRDSQMNLGEAFDALLASLVRTSRPPARPAPPTVEEVVTESTALTIVKPTRARRTGGSTHKGPTRRKGQRR